MYNFHVRDYYWNKARAIEISDPAQYMCDKEWNDLIEKCMEEHYHYDYSTALIPQF